MEETSMPGGTEELRRELERERDRNRRLSAFFQDIADKLSEAVYVKDGQGRYVGGNRAFARLMQCRGMDDLRGRTDADFYDDETFARLREKDCRVMSAQSVSQFEQPMILSDGRRHELRMTQFRSTDQDGMPCLVGLAEDRTDMLSAQARAHDAEKAREYFFSTVSHEMRTPLNAIAGYAQILQANPGAEKSGEALAGILSSTKGLIDVVDGMLNLSRLESGCVTVVPETTDVHEMAIKAVEAFAEAAGEKRLDLRVDICDMPLVELDRRLVTQVVSRLLDNAVKFTESGYVGMRVGFANGVLTIGVEDTGVGMSAEDISKATVPYSEIGAGLKRGRAGLGLAVSRRIVERMGGWLEISSTPGKGTVVTVSIPGVKPASEASRREFSRTQKMRTMRIEDPFRYDKRILVVDDSSVNIRVLEGLLKVIGFKKIDSATGGAEALNRLKGSKYDIILTDIQMPGMDGAQLARAVRAMPDYAETPVYAVTADTNAPQTCAGCGFTDILFKPMTLAELKAKVC